MTKCGAESELGMCHSEAIHMIKLPDGDSLSLCGPHFNELMQSVNGSQVA